MAGTNIIFYVYYTSSLEKVIVGVIGFTNETKRQCPWGDCIPRGETGNKQKKINEMIECHMVYMLWRKVSQAAGMEQSRNNFE